MSSATPASASVPAYDPANDKDFGPATIEHRTAGSGLAELGTYFMVFQDSGHADPWTLQYEETAYVIEGRVHFIVENDGREEDLRADAGELVVLPKGTTVRYGATIGTLLLLSISPVDWRARA